MQPSTKMWNCSFFHLNICMKCTYIVAVAARRDVNIAMCLRWYYILDEAKISQNICSLLAQPHVSSWLLFFVPFSVLGVCIIIATLVSFSLSLSLLLPLPPLVSSIVFLLFIKCIEHFPLYIIHNLTERYFVSISTFTFVVFFICLSVFIHLSDLYCLFYTYCDRMFCAQKRGWIFFENSISNAMPKYRSPNAIQFVYK